ncbi:MAG: lipid-binding SYLF domain-containing protein [Gammaproteobacteria bacterium]
MPIHALKNLIITCILLISSTQLSANEATAEALVDAASNSVNTFTIDPDMKWFRDNMNKAKGVLIVPQLVKGGLIFGGSGGSGVLLVRGDGNIWSDPAFYTMGSGTVGFQIGVEVSEIILMVMTEKGVDALLTSSFKLGGDVSIAAGPIGAGAKAQTADILAFSRTKGIYGGVNIEGAVLKIRNDWNHDYYGKETSPRAILIERNATNSHADELRNAVANLAIKSGS